MFKVAMLSGWHVHAKGYAQELIGLSDVEITTVWDNDQERGSKWAEEIGAVFEDDLDRILANEQIDGVVVTTETSMHSEVIIKAAKAGKHIFTEKVLALTVKECKEIEQAVEKSGVKFCISFPHRTRSDILFAKDTLEKGLLGDITLLRIRNAHNGSIADWLPEHFYDHSACGGGAMIDLGAHGMYLSRWLLGKPIRITSIFNNVTGRQVEDNAVSVIEFANKALAINETGFVSTNDPFSLELNGTKGSLLVGGPTGGVHINSVKTGSEIKGWITPSKLPDPLPTPIEQWVGGIINNQQIYFGIKEGTELTELMEASYLSFKSGKMVELNDLKLK